jgi:plastocyanin
MKHFACAFVALFLPSAAALSATFDVTVGPGLSFNPNSITITQGDTIRWVWQGASHSSTSNTNTGPEVWDSGIIATGTFTHTFATVGDWPYYCSLHSSPTGTAMNGVVHVLAPAPAPTPTLSTAALMLLLIVLMVIGVIALRR